MKTLAREVLAEGRVSAYVRETVKLENGETVDREFMESADSVAILLLDGEERVLTVSQYRHPIGQRLIELPAGMIDPGEEQLQAAKRELAEEASMAAGTWQKLLEQFVSPGGYNAKRTIFLAQKPKALSVRPEGFKLEAEEASIELEWAPLEELVQGVLSGDLKSPSLSTGVLALEAKRLRGELDAVPTKDHWQTLAEASGLSTGQLGRLFGVSSRTFENWLIGKEEPSSFYVERRDEVLEEILPLGSNPKERKLALLSSSKGMSIFHSLIEQLPNMPVLEPVAFTASEVLGV